MIVGLAAAFGCLPFDIRGPMMNDDRGLGLIAMLSAGTTPSPRADFALLEQFIVGEQNGMHTSQSRHALAAPFFGKMHEHAHRGRHFVKTRPFQR